ncbi:hypothetical protein P262_03612 [Cronobacter malonaticus]|uniref:Uncharacterized protein n=1 Tax=Cronobacter malonaticus TaxID=413503 RepID=V5U1R0_9ENTR|nr:hypothetical protein P262_03612 [Cronobacter malonaticus]
MCCCDVSLTLIVASRVSCNAFTSYIRGGSESASGQPGFYDINAFSESLFLEK